MNKYLYLAVILLSCMVSLTRAENTEALDNDGEVVFVDPEQKIDLQTGEEFVIGLEGNKTTGYEWQYAEPVDDEFLESEGEEYVVFNDAIMGSGGEQRFKYKALTEGETTVKFVYLRPWEKDTAPAKTSEFSISIKDQGEND